MKAVILAGGLGTRLSEETVVKPKPMVEIGGKPILWHILKSDSAHSINDFVICCGYKGYIIKEFFANYFRHKSDVTFDMRSNSMAMHQRYAEPWRVTLVGTGESTQTGGRLKRVRQHVEGDEAFCFTYGDGVSNVNLTALIDFHKAHGRLATMTAVQPPGRFGALELDGSQIVTCKEKPQGDGNWINGGYFVLSPRAIDLIPGDGTLGSAIRSSNWPRHTSCKHINMAAFGNRWIRCATSMPWKNCGKAARHHGRVGHESKPYS